MDKVTEIDKDPNSFVEFNIALQKAWDELQEELQPVKAYELKIYYESAKKHIQKNPDYAAKTIAIGLAKKVKYINKHLRSKEGN